MKEANTEMTAKRIGIGIVLLLILAYFLVSVVPMAYQNILPSDRDQEAYLMLGLQIRHRLALTDGMRNPLYPLLLATIARVDIGYFTTAKVLSILIGLLGLLVIYATARQIIDQSGALAVTLMMAINYEYRFAAKFVHVEVLLVPLMLIAWYWTGKGIQSAAEDKEKGDRYAFIAGLLIGTVYLTKGTGTLLAMAFIMALLCVQGLMFVKYRTIWYFVAGFSIIAMPLWIYNLTHYGNPLFNFNFSHAIWLDQWECSYVYSPEELPTLSTYLQTHTIEEIIRRLVKIAIRAPRQWYRAARPFWVPYWSPSWAIWGCFGAGILTLAKVTHRVIQRWRALRGWYLFSLTAAGLFFLSFGWYGQTNEAPRFILPLVPMLYIALLLLVQEESAFLPGLQKWISGSLIVICLILPGVYLGWHLADLELLAKMRAHDQHKNRENIHLMEAVIQRTRPGEAVVLGPTYALAEWLAFDREILPIPYVRQDWHSFSAWMVERGVRCVILDSPTWKRRRPLLAQYWDLHDGLVATELPPGWTLVDPPIYPCDPCLFAFDGASVVKSEPEYPTSVRYEDLFTLLGYDIEPSPLQANQPWRIILYWQVLSSTDEDIHVFVHLLDDSGELIGQHDGIMAQGRLPAYDLLPTTVVRDSHPLPSLPDGTYPLYIGLYRWETQERLSAIQREQPVLNAYPEVGKVKVQFVGH